MYGVGDDVVTKFLWYLFFLRRQHMIDCTIFEQLLFFMDLFLGLRKANVV